MAKQYNGNGMLLGEELHKTVPLSEWIKDALQMNSEPVSMFSFLNEKGRLFKRIVETHPEHVMYPTKIVHLQCHTNNILYGAMLMQHQPQILDDFAFVSGFYGMRAISDEVPEDKRYFIGNHSFMTYKGAVLDHTTLQYPPNLYKVDQYFGIAFEIEVMVNAFINVFKKDHPNGPPPVLEVLLNEPCLEE